MGSDVANHSQIIDALQPELVVWLRTALREYDPGWFDFPKKGKLIMDLFSQLADFIGMLFVIMNIFMRYPPPLTPPSQKMQQAMSCWFVSTGGRDQRRLCWHTS